MPTWSADREPPDPDILHDYQKRAVNFQCTSPTSMLWLDMGLGKTVITLTSIAHLLNTGS